MAGVTEEDFENFLLEIKFQSSTAAWTWMISNGPTEEFVKWLCKNVNGSNYLSDEELNEYKKLEEMGQVLEGEELEKAISEKIPEYFELSDIDDYYISALKDELHYLQNHSQSLAVWAEKQQNEVLAIQREVSEFENEIVNQKNKLVNNQTECLGESSLLDSSMQRLNNNLVYLKKYFEKGVKDVSNGIFLSEIPINNYIEESAAFSRELELNVEQVISSADMKKGCNISSRATFGVQLKKLKKGLRDTLLLKAEETARRKGLERACVRVKGLLDSRELWKFSTDPHSAIDKLAEQKKKLQSLKAHAKQCGLIEDLAVEPRGKLGEVVMKYVSRQCVSLEDLHKELRFHQKQIVCDNLRKLEVVLKNQCATDLVWLFLLGEEVTEVMDLSELAKSGESFLIKEKQDRLLRIEGMKFLKERKNCEINKAETWCLFNFLLNFLKPPQAILSKSDHSSVNSGLPYLEDIFHSLKSLAEYTEKCESDNMKLELLMKQMSDQRISMLQSRCQELVKLKSLVCSGSTENNPEIWSVNQLTFCCHPDTITKKLKRRIGKLNTKYQEEKQKISADENIARNLWKIFITNPEGVKTLIDHGKLPVILINDELSV